MELRPFDVSDEALVETLQQQEDVWEFIGTSPLSAFEPDNRMFVITDGGVALGFAGLFKSQSDGDDFELICATRSEAQHRGAAAWACERVMAWALDTAKIERVIAYIDASNHPARAIAAKIGMTEMERISPDRIRYVKYRGG
jgi:RimJ/RimL family protein N-acetyltransferase